MNFFDIILRIVTRAGFTTKASGDANNLTPTEVDNNFLAIVDEVQGRDIAGAFATWSAGTVEAGMVKIYDSKLWLALTTNSATPSEGTDWTQINLGTLGHAQNTDTYLDRFGTNEVTAAQIKSGIRPYKVFTSLVSQAETGAPTMTILENTLSGTPVFSYDDVGEYELTLAGEFVNNKTAIFTSVLINDNLFRTYTAVRVSNDVIEVKSYNAGTLANTMLSNSILEIRIYP